MARYRKGDRYLSEEEYREEQKNNWIMGLFLIGAGVSGFFVYTKMSGMDLPKWIKFVSVITAAVVGGGVLGALYRQIQVILGFALIGGLIYYAGTWLWGKM